MSEKNPFRTRQIRRSILETLQMTGGYALETNALETFVNDQLRPPLQPDEWKDAINWLGLGEYIAIVPNDMDTTMKQWCITERGKTLLRSA
jgi:hypothetical protein